jgi:hypothetical protein
MKNDWEEEAKFYRTELSTLTDLSKCFSSKDITNKVKEHFNEMRKLLLTQDEVYTDLAEDAVIAATKRQQHSIQLQKELKIANKKIEACMDFFNENLEQAHNEPKDERLAWAMRFMIDKLKSMEIT